MVQQRLFALTKFFSNGLTAVIGTSEHFARLVLGVERRGGVHSPAVRSQRGGSFDDVVCEYEQYSLRYSTAHAALEETTHPIQG